MEHIKLEDIIRKYISLPLYPNATGWYPVLCKVCGDHGRKGLRAAFNFNDGSVSYHCFNCGHKAGYNPQKSQSPDERMIKVLNSFEIPEEEWKPLFLNELEIRSKRGTTQTVPKQINIKIEPEEIPLPEHFYKLGPEDSTDKWTIIARDYLENERGINPDSYPFYLSTGKGDKFNQKWLGRVIIPFYKDNKLIFYQGRSLLKNITRKYESPNVEKSKVLFGYENILKNTDEPLYIVEGWFDAFLIGGVAILGNRITKEQLVWINKSKRLKVVIPDIYGDGARLANQALKLGWAVSIPDFLSHGYCKDVNEGIVKYGKLFVMKSIIENTQTGFLAETSINLYCRKKR